MRAILPSISSLNFSQLKTLKWAGMGIEPTYSAHASTIELHPHELKENTGVGRIAL